MKMLSLTVSVPPSSLARPPPSPKVPMPGVAGENAVADRQRPGVVNAAAVTAAGIASSDRHPGKANGHAASTVKIGNRASRSAAAGYGEAYGPGALDVDQPGGVAQVRQGGVERDCTGDGEVDRVIAGVWSTWVMTYASPERPEPVPVSPRLLTVKVDSSPVFEAFQTQPSPGVGTPGRGEPRQRSRGGGPPADLGFRNATLEVPLGIELAGKKKPDRRHPPDRAFVTFVHSRHERCI